MNETFATTQRLSRQLFHDPHTIALVLLIPSVLMIVLRFVFQNQSVTFQAAGSTLLAIFPFLIMFLVSSISMLRERKAGTLERLMTLPITRIQIVSGYLITFGFLAAMQAIILGLVTLRFLGIDTAFGSEIHVVGIAMLAGLLGTGFGLFTSAFATSEFQAVQFMPAFVFPQVMVCGLFAPKEEMAWPLQWFANITPPSYLVDAMHNAVDGFGWPAHELLVIAIFMLASVIMAAVSIRVSK